MHTLSPLSALCLLWNVSCYVGKEAIVSSEREKKRGVEGVGSCSGGGTGCIFVN